MLKPLAPTVLTQRYDDAVKFAREAHDGQVRKSTGTPYISHLLTVSGKVIDVGGDEDEAIAALLHDTVEDVGVTFDEIQARFGLRVRELVDACTEPHKKPDWTGGTQLSWVSRKALFVAQVRNPEFPASAAKIIAADKLHNLGSLFKQLFQEGSVAWEALGGTPADQIEHHGKLKDALGPKLRSDDLERSLWKELATLVNDVEQLHERHQVLASLASPQSAKSPVEMTLF